MREVTMLTTVDNPHSPFDDWDAWYVFDTTHGYDTCGLLARVTFDSEELSDSDNEISTRAAIDEIIKENITGMHRKVTKIIDE